MKTTDHEGMRAVFAERRGLWRFCHDEAGTLTIFGLVTFLLMIMMGGIAVDVMRYEARRTSVQNTLDRATLAAASLSQAKDPTSVVNDYFSKAGASSYLRSVTVTQGLNFRNVNATALAATNPLFLNLIGQSQFDAKGNSTAEQRINNVEIMLVLDVSGSMASNSKLVNLKNAANQFVSTILTNDGDHKISIGIVPFNGQVNLGPTLKAKFNVTEPNTLPGSTASQAGVDCVDLPTEAYTAYAVSTTLALPQTANVDTYSSSSTTSPNEANKWCPTVNTAVSPTAYYAGNPAGTGGNIVRLPQQNVATLQGYINGLSAVGATSINAGVKWGMTLLDPSMQSIYTSYITAGKMPSTMAGRPLSYTADDSMKVLILMTDGENFMEERANTNYKTVMSPLWQSTSDSKWSIFDPNKVNSSNSTNLCKSKPYYVQSANNWQVRPWNGTTPKSSDCYVPSTTTAPSGATNRTWPEVWLKVPMQWVAQNLYAASGMSTFANQMNLFRRQTATTTMDTQMQTACTAAKNAGVIIYGIAFEAPTNGQTQIANCASGPANYFDASGIQITTAFAAIANNISQLRLTQ